MSIRVAGQVIEYGVQAERDTRVAGQVIEYGVQSDPDLRVATQIVEYGVTSFEFQMANFILGEAIIIPGNEETPVTSVFRGIQGAIAIEQNAAYMQGAFLVHYSGQKTGQI